MNPNTATATTTTDALSFDVSDADFEAQVIQRSQQVPVLLDCWAPWCGPCRTLKPMLEKLAAAYGGRFVLAKLDSDQNPQVSAMLGLRSIPHVVLFKNGRPVDQFNGALPEAQLRAFLDRHLPALSDAEQLRRQAETAEPEQALAWLRAAHALDAADEAVRLDLATRLVASGQQADAAEARALLEAVPAPLRGERHLALLAKLDFAALKPAGDAAALQARIAANTKDFEARFDLAALQAHDGDFGAAFEQLLEVVLRDKGEARETARARMVEWFTLCSDAKLVDKSRRLLSMYLN